MQGAAPVGDSFAITASEGNTVSELDGDDVHATLLPLLKAEDERRRDAESRGDTAALGLLMAGVSVPISPRSGVGGSNPRTRAGGGGGGAAHTDEPRPYVMRPINGFSGREETLSGRQHALLSLGAASLVPILCAHWPQRALLSHLSRAISSPGLPHPHSSRPFLPPIPPAHFSRPFLPPISPARFSRPFLPHVSRRFCLFVFGAA